MARPESVLRRGATLATPSAFTQLNRVHYTMADTFTSLHYHVVFSTKGREPRLRLDMQERVWAYLGGIARQNQLRPLLIGGTEDHIHVLLGIPPTRQPRVPWLATLYGPLVEGLQIFEATAIVVYQRNVMAHLSRRAPRRRGDG